MGKTYDSMELDELIDIQQKLMAERAKAEEGFRVKQLKVQAAIDKKSQED